MDQLSKYKVNKGFVFCNIYVYNKDTFSVFNKHKPLQAPRYE